MELRICILPAGCSLGKKKRVIKENIMLPKQRPIFQFSWFKILIAKISSDY